MRFDRIVTLDWSAAGARSPARPSADAIWLGLADVTTGRVHTRYLRSRAEAEAALHDIIAQALDEGARLLLGADFPFGYPRGFAAALTGKARALAVWDWFSAHLHDGPDNRNNRFALAAAINALFPGTGPFWGRPRGLDLPGLPDLGRARQGHGMPELRHVETHASGAQPVWKLYTTGSVGGQAITGLPVMARLRARFAGQVAVWPFEDANSAPVVLSEVYFSVLAAQVRAALVDDPGAIKDEVQVRLLASALARLAVKGGLAPLFQLPCPDDQRPDVLHEEGWILGVGHEGALRAALSPDTPDLAPDPDPATRAAPARPPDDCFALPPGVDWTPVDQALARLRAALPPVAPVQTLPLAQADGRVLAAPVHAARANPPAPNAAVDGYAYAHHGLPEPQRDGRVVLDLLPGRSAAGAPFGGVVGPGQAVRILTGALLPAGVDTVVMQEDCVASPGQVALIAPRPGANTRPAGEDVAAGAELFAAGHRLAPQDIALIAATGTGSLALRAPLRVAVLSTGDELCAPGATALPHQTYDANRPMLAALLARWGIEVLDLGAVGDNRDALRARLDSAADRADALITTGGASDGDEDHVSALMRAEGQIETWRIAIKPGRPLALGQWRRMPVFGLPGNPVAAFVCALIFARPALMQMQGAPWHSPRALMLPAGFAKRKKAGRREYLRARLGEDGRVQVFASEGSGRISGLSWASGLVELPDEAATIAPGDPVRWLPFSEFGL